MPLVDFSQEDIDRSKVLDPGWYRVRVEEVDAQISKKGDSTNYWLKGKILKDSNGKELNIPTPMWIINSKVKAPLVAIFSALGVNITAGSRADVDDLIGKEFDAFIANEEYNGNMQMKMTNKYKKAA